jgi:hypothetical protein
MKAYCKTCGRWLNIHEDGKCHDCHYGHEQGRAFPTAATPEAVARERGGTDRALVDVEFPPVTGDYADARRREADEARERAETEPILGRLTEKGQELGQGVNRVSPAGADANDRRESPDQALSSEVEAAVSNVEGMQRDVEQMIDPPKISEIDPAEAGDADLAKGVERAVAKDRKATDKTADRNRAAREEEQAQARADEERQARAAKGPATTQSRADAIKK